MRVTTKLAALFIVMSASVTACEGAAHDAAVVGAHDIHDLHIPHVDADGLRVSPVARQKLLEDADETEGTDPTEIAEAACKARAAIELGQASTLGGALPPAAELGGADARKVAFLEATDIATDEDRTDATEKAAATVFCLSVGVREP